MTGEKINRRPPKKCLTRVSKKQSIVSEIKSPHTPRPEPRKHSTGEALRVGAAPNL